MKTPLLTLAVISDVKLISDVQSLESYVKEELNVRDIILTRNEEQYNILLEARVDWLTLGKKLKKDVQIVRNALPNLTQAQLRQYLQNKTMTINGLQLEGNDLAIVRILGKNTRRDSNSGGPQWEAASSDDFRILLDIASHPELLDEGLNQPYPKAAEEGRFSTDRRYSHAIWRYF